MRKMDPAGIAWFRIVIEGEFLADFKRSLLFREGADTQLGALEIGQYGDRPFDAPLHIANAGDQRAHRIMVGVAHIDAEDIGARFIELFDHRLVGGGGPERGENLDLATTLHCPDAPVTAASSAVCPSVS